MKTFTYYHLTLCLLLFIVACKTSTQKKPDQPATPRGLVMGNPINYYDDSTLLFPVGCDYKPTNDNLVQAPTTEAQKEKLFPNQGCFTYSVTTVSATNGLVNSVEQYTNSAPDDFDMRNLLFMNKYTHHCYTLCDSSMHILSFEIHKEFVKPYVIYKAIKHDTNNDSLYTAKDIVTAYLSRPDGSDFIQLTPDGESYDTYFFYPETQTVLFKTFRDSNNDYQISQGDESNFFEVNLRNPQPGHSIFPDSLRAKLKKYI